MSFMSGPARRRNLAALVATRLGDKGDRSHRTSTAQGKGLQDPPCLDKAGITTELGGQGCGGVDQGDVGDRES